MFFFKGHSSMNEQKSFRLKEIQDIGSLAWVARSTSEGTLLVSDLNWYIGSFVYDLKLDKLLDGSEVEAADSEFMDVYGRENLLFECCLHDKSVFSRDFSGGDYNMYDSTCPFTIIDLSS